MKLLQPVFTEPIEWQATLLNVVFAKAAAQDIKENFSNNGKSIPEWDNSKVIKAGENILINHNWDVSRRLMWNYVGIVRSNDRLKKAKDKMKLIKNEVQEFYKILK